MPSEKALVNAGKYGVAVDDTFAQGFDGVELAAAIAVDDEAVSGRRVATGLLGGDDHAFARFSDALEAAGPLVVESEIDDAVFGCCLSGQGALEPIGVELSFAWSEALACGQLFGTVDGGAHLAGIAEEITLDLFLELGDGPSRAGGGTFVEFGRRLVRTAVDDDRGAALRQALGDSPSESTGRSSDPSDFAFEQRAINSIHFVSPTVISAPTRIRWLGSGKLNIRRSAPQINRPDRLAMGVRIPYWRHWRHWRPKGE